MKDSDKTKFQLIQELSELRQLISALEKSQTIRPRFKVLRFKHASDFSDSGALIQQQINFSKHVMIYSAWNYGYVKNVADMTVLFSYLPAKYVPGLNWKKGVSNVLVIQGCP